MQIASHIRVSGDAQHSKLLSKLELYNTTKVHMMKEFKDTIEKYISLSIKSGNKVSSISSNLEKLEYYIKYEIDQDKNGFLMQEKMREIFQIIMYLKEEIKSYKTPMGTKSILKALKQNNIGHIDIPNNIFKQRFSYYKGELARKCSHYDEAINQYTKVIYKYGNKISDAYYVVKAFKKIIIISSLFARKYELLKKDKEMKMMHRYIMSKREEINKFRSMNKDYIIIINSYNRSEFIKNALEKARYIIDNYITYNDRFSLSLISNNEMKIISKLQYKDISSNDLIYDFIQSLIQDKSFINNTSIQGEDNLKDMLHKTKSYLIKKNPNDERRDVFYIFLTHTISITSRDYLCHDDFISSFNQNEHFLLLLHDNPIEKLKFSENIENKEKYKSFLDNFDKLSNSGLLHIEELNEIKNKLKIYGEINYKKSFPFEKF